MTTPNESTEPQAVDQTAAAPAVENAAPAAKPDAPKPDPQVAEMAARLAEYEAREREAEQAKLTEAEKLKADRLALDRERFSLDLQKAGIPEAVARLFDPGDATPKRRGVIVGEITSAWSEAIKAEAAKVALPAAPHPAPASGRPLNPVIPTPKPGAKEKQNPYKDIARQMRLRRS